jgi:hypothetical protein
MTGIWQSVRGRSSFDVRLPLSYVGLRELPTACRARDRGRATARIGPAGRRSRARRGPADGGSIPGELSASWVQSCFRRPVVIIGFLSGRDSFQLGDDIGAVGDQATALGEGGKQLLSAPAVDGEEGSRRGRSTQGSEAPRAAGWLRRGGRARAVCQAGERG